MSEAIHSASRAHRHEKSTQEILHGDARQENAGRKVGQLSDDDLDRLLRTGEIDMVDDTREIYLDQLKPDED